MRFRFKGVALGVVLFTVSGSAFAQCERMQVIIRNQIWPINNLDAFCQDYGETKRNVARLMERLAWLEQENRELRARLEAQSGSDEHGRLALGKP